MLHSRWVFRVSLWSENKENKEGRKLERNYMSVRSSFLVVASSMVLRFGGGHEGVAFRQLTA